MKLLIDLKGSSKVNIPTFPNKPNHVTRVGYKAAVCDRQCGMLNWGGLWCLQRVSDCLVVRGGVQRETGSRLLNLIPSPAASWQVRPAEERALTEFH